MNIPQLILDKVLSAVGTCLPLNQLLISLNNKDFRIVKLLGEGGFSMVYLVRDISSERQFALKKIICNKEDAETFQLALREVEIMKLFNSPNIVKPLDVCIVNQEDGGKIVYLFMDYFEKGSLLDAITENFSNNRKFSEREVIEVFIEVCKAVQLLHNHCLPETKISDNESNGYDGSLPQVEGSSMDWGESNSIKVTSLNNTKIWPPPLKRNGNPYAHRDIKPGNVLIAKDGSAILMDFGSAEKARIKIKTRQDALTEQDKAAKYSTLTYRAPELFDVEVGTDITEAVDIWSMGCLLYAIAYGVSPFEASVTEHGGSTALAVMNGNYTYPKQDPYSANFHDLIAYMLVTDPKLRPNIDQVLERTEAHLTLL